MKIKIKILDHEYVPLIGQIYEACITSTGEQAVFWDLNDSAHFAYNWSHVNKKQFEIIEDNVKQLASEKFLENYTPSRLDYFTVLTLQTVLKANQGSSINTSDSISEAIELSQRTISAINWSIRNDEGTR